MGFERNLRDDVTHWPVTGSDGFGGFTYGNPVLLPGRWEDQSIQFVTDNMEEAISTAIVYLNTDVDVGDYLGFGDHATVPIANPTSLTTAHRIRQRHRTTDLRRMQSLRKVFL